LFFFFFFQAEDGIRDFHVTGVQTCALPIYATEDACGCRKPHPGMLERAAREHALALHGCYVVGDRYADLEMAHQVGGRGILVLTGYGRGEHELHRGHWPRQPCGVAENLSLAADLILEELR